MDEDHSLMTIAPAAARRFLDENPPQQVGRGFSQHELLGQGGMGAVYRGEQTCFPRPVALKSLLPGRDRPQDRQSFTAESLITALLDHPNIPPVHDLLTDAEQPRLAMKIIQGRDWQSLLKDPQALSPGGESLSLEEHLDIFLKVCDAVAFAHEQGIIHRDIKPSNVMIGSFGEVTLMDWGCAVAYRSPPLHPLIPLAYDAQGLAGTPAYMAPEMAKAANADLGPHSDIFLLGACLYEILTGSPPHHPRRQGSSSLMEILAQAVDPNIEPPNQRSPEREIPPGLARIAMRAMEFEPRQRFPSVASLIAAVQDWRHQAQLDRVLAVSQQTIHRAQSGDIQALNKGMWEAIAGCDYVNKEVPDHREAQGMLLQALLLSARYALSQESWELAQRQINRAHSLAIRAPWMQDDVALAEREVKQAVLRGRRRQRMVAWMGWSSYALLGILLIISLMVYIHLSGNQRRANFALAEAQRLQQQASALTQQASQTEEDLLAGTAFTEQQEQLQNIQQERRSIETAVQALEKELEKIQDQHHQYAEALLQEYASDVQRIWSGR